MPKLAIIDGDILLYRCGFAAEKMLYQLYQHTEEGLTLLPLTDKRAINKHIKDNPDDAFEVYDEHQVEPPGHAVHALRELLDRIITESGATKGYKIFLSGPTEQGFRYKLATIREYKGNRKDALRPVHYELLKQYLIDKWGAVVVNRIEADDACAINAPGNVVCTIDKDLLQVPGLHHRFTDGKDVFEVDQMTADQHLFSQILTGDTTDNIVGCPGIGEKKAQEILLNCATAKEMLQAVRSTYIERWPEESTLTPDEALDENAALVYLLRNGEDQWDRNKYS